MSCNYSGRRIRYSKWKLAPTIKLASRFGNAEKMGVKNDERLEDDGRTQDTLIDFGAWWERRHEHTQIE